MESVRDADQIANVEVEDHSDRLKCGRLASILNEKCIYMFS
jgi:hypothetical protein